ncbi:MAG: ubiquinol-cytochrome c reductase iron-sulfur subunit [Mangrovibacterium sp.]
MDRRNFLKKAIGGIIGLQFAALFYSFFRNNKPTEQAVANNWLELGMVDDFQNGKTYSFPNNKLFLHRTVDGEFLALSNKCTHLGCAINLNTQTGGFVCPCHSSHFDELGNVVQSPAKRALDYYPIHIQAQKILVDLNGGMKRASFNKNQLTSVS